MRSKRIIRRVEIDNRHALLEESGGGPPVVLLPSILVRAKTYRWLTDRLRQRFRVIAVEPPGSGGGSKLEEPWSFQQYADFLVRLLDVLQLERPTLLTHSNSGPVGLLLAAQHPDRVSRLILADPTGFAPAPVWRLAVGRFIDGVIEAPFSMNAIRDVVYNTVTHRATVANQIRLAALTDLAEVARQVRIPTLIAWGKLDFTFPVRAAHELQALMPRSTLYTLERGSHDWLVQHAAAFNVVVTRFMIAKSI